MSRITIEQLHPELYVRMAPIAANFTPEVFTELYRAVMLPTQSDIDEFIEGDNDITVGILADCLITESLDAIAAAFCNALTFWEEMVLVPKGETRYDH